MGRAPCCEKLGLKRGKWKSEEDEILTKYIHAHGEGSWRSLPKNAGLLRSGKSCRLRWINYLRADLKRGNFTAEEEETIVKLHRAFGNRWSLIAAHLPGRTDNGIKNYWNSHLSRKIYSFIKLGNEYLPTILNDVKKITSCNKHRKGARASRSTMNNKSKNKNKNLAPFNSRKSEANPQLGNPSLPTGTIINLGQVGNEDINLRGLESWDPIKNGDGEAIGMLGMQYSCLDSAEMINLDPCGEQKKSAQLCLGKKENNITGSSTAIYGDNDGETEVLGTSCECVGTMDLNNNIFEIEGRRSTSIWSSSNAAESGGGGGGGELYSFASSMNSGFDDEWLDWGWAGGGLQCHNGELEWRDEGETIAWLWENGSTGEGQ